MSPRPRLRIVATAVLVLLLVATVATAAPVRTARASAAAPCTVSTALRRGSTGPAVACLEARLLGLGYRLAGPDQTFGPSTSAAVRAYQREAHLHVDGIAGPMTERALGIWAAPVATLPTPPALVDPVPAAVIETRTIGTSVQGRPIVARRMGTPGGKVVLVIGIIHGDEQQGARITALVRTMATPAGIDLWLIDSFNPDGVAANTRTNANGVDLNRNFPHGWSYIPRSDTNHQYSGEQPADQPETQALIAFVGQIRPAITIWYHQDANTLSINGADKAVPTAYGRYTGLVPRNVPCTAGCTGTASSWVNATVRPSTSFIVELPGTPAVTDAMVQTHASALLAVLTL